jgi:hypothetical protein
VFFVASRCYPSAFDMSYVSDRPSSSPAASPSSSSQSALTPEAFSPVSSVETSADALMDEVFADIERMIECGIAVYAPEDTSNEAGIFALDHPAHEEEQDLDAAVDGAADTAQTGLEGNQADALAVLPKVSPRELTMGEAEIDAEVLLSLAQEPPQQPSRSLDTLLVSIIFAILAITGGVWFYLRHYRAPQSAAPIAATAPSEMSPAEGDREFLAYVQRSLERIDRSKKQAETVATETSPAPTVLERIYIPIYQPPVAALPSASPTLPVPPPVAVAPIPAPAPAPPVALPPPTVPASPSPTIVPNIAAAPVHVLIGLLELGDRSAALFEIEGTPHRIQVGERIGSSGWTLVSISNQEAMIRRNGEVRSVYIGQQF